MRRRVKNVIIKTSAWAAFIVCIYSACRVVAEWTPVIAFGVSFLYLVLVGCANGWMVINDEKMENRRPDQRF